MQLGSGHCHPAAPRIYLAHRDLLVGDAQGRIARHERCPRCSFCKRSERKVTANKGVPPYGS